MKAQINMFETIGVLIIFFFLLVTAATMYFQLQKTSFRQQLTQQTALESLSTTQRALTLPELDCSFVTIQKENCFDEYKLAAFTQLLQQEETLIDYYPLFGHSTITINKLYPTQQRFTIYDNKPPSHTQALFSYSPITLYDPTTKTHSFGIIDVTVYQ